jgi:hypothetical protein
MAFTVETGAIVSGANSLASVSDADAYTADRGIAAWADYSSAEKQAALILATDYLEAAYRDAWRGERVSASQSLSWPRRGVVVDGFAVPMDIVPLPVVRACIEMAIRAAAGDTLISDQGQLVKREKIDVIEIEYADYSDPSQRYPQVSKMLAPYTVGAIHGMFAQVRVLRA